MNRRRRKPGWKCRHSRDRQRRDMPFAKARTKPDNGSMQARRERPFRAAETFGRFASRQPLKMAEHDSHSISLRQREKCRVEVEPYRKVALVLGSLVLHWPGDSRSAAVAANDISDRHRG